MVKNITMNIALTMSMVVLMIMIPVMSMFMIVAFIIIVMANGGISRSKAGGEMLKGLHWNAKLHEYVDSSGDVPCKSRV